jgi:Zn-finger nucleic acid-binding protein
VEKNINFLIEHQCPQCGGPVTLQETDRLFTCEFCQVKSYLLENGYFRYQLPHNAAEQEQLFYFPYWRFKGMLFSVSPTGIKERFVDVSHQAIGSRHIPVSLGFRSQALKLKFVTPKSAGIFLKPVQSSEQVMDILDQRFSKDFPKPVLHIDHIGENLSLIFAPYYLKENKVFDAVLNRPVSAQLPDDHGFENFNSDPVGAHLKFLPTLCPECGWDLWGQRDSLTLYCKNCESVWHPRNQQLKKTNTAFLHTQFSNTLYLPFWRIGANITGISLFSYADFIRITNLPKVVQPSWENVPFRFWGPAFKVRPQRYLKLARGITISQPTHKLIRGMPKTDQLVAVNLPLKEALETLKINLASLIRPRQLMVDSIQEIQIDPKSYLLVYLPFEVGPHEFIQPDLNLAINKNQLNLASNL